MGQAGNDASFDWVAHNYYDWDISRCLLCSQRGRDVERYDHVYLEPDELSRELGQPI